MGWRKPVSSLNYLLSLHVWRQDHNGYSHQDPGFIEEGTTTLSDMTVLNELDRYHLAQEAILRVPGLADAHPELLDDLQERIAEHHHYVHERGEDVPEVQN